MAGVLKGTEYQPKKVGLVPQGFCMKTQSLSSPEQLKTEMVPAE